MNEQQLADLFSEQIDRMLQGDTSIESPGAEELDELLNLGKQISQTQFQASPAAQAAFASQIASWFGALNGGNSMTILGLSKIWFISIIVTVLVVITGFGFIAVITTGIFVFGSDEVVVVPTVEPTAEPTTEATVEPTTEPTGEATTEPTDEATGEPTAEPTGEPTAEPTDEPSGGPVAPPITIIIKNSLIVPVLCQGSYFTQQTLVNYGSAPVDNAALAWEVIEGADFVDHLDFISSIVEEAPAETDDDTAAVSSATAADDDSSPIISSGFANLSQISVEQNVKLDVKVKVNDKWWQEPDGTKIKVKLSIKNKIEFDFDDDDDDDDGDHDRGHGNDPDGFDEDNPGRGHRRHRDYGQVVTIVKQGAKWITLTGIAHPFGNQNFLVDGRIVVINNCTGLPVQLPIGSNVQVIGILLPDGTFNAINITIININIFTGNFNSGVPTGGGSSSDDDDDGGSRGGGGGRGGSRGGSGGSRGGSGGSGGS